MRRDNLYNNLISSGKVTAREIGDIEEFRQCLSNPGLAENMYNNLRGIFSEKEIGSHDQFIKAIASDEKSKSAVRVFTPQELEPVDNSMGEKPERGFGFSLKQETDRMKQNLKMLAGTVANTFTGSSVDTDRAMKILEGHLSSGEKQFDTDKYKLGERDQQYRQLMDNYEQENARWLKEHPDIWSRIKGYGEAPERPKNPREIEMVVPDPISGVSELAGEWAENRPYRIVKEALEESGGDPQKARRYIAERKKEMTWGDRQQAEAMEAVSRYKPTEGFGAFIGGLIPQMAGSLLAVATALTTKTRFLAKPVQAINMATLTGSSMGGEIQQALEYEKQTGEHIPRDRLMKAAAINGMVEYGTEKIPFDRYLGRFGNLLKKQATLNTSREIISNPAAAKELDQLLTRAGKELPFLKKITKTGLKEYAGDVLTEGISEFSAEFLQSYVPLIYQHPEDYPNLWQALENGLEGAKGGLFMGSVIGGFSGAGNHYAQNQRRKAQGKIVIADTPLGIVEVTGRTAGGYQAINSQGKIIELTPEQINDQVTVGWNEFQNYRQKATAETLELARLSGYMSLEDLTKQREIVSRKKEAEKELGDDLERVSRVEERQIPDFLQSEYDRMERHPERNNYIKKLENYFESQSLYNGMLQSVKEDITQRSQQEASQRVSPLINPDIDAVMSARVAGYNEPVYIVGKEIQLTPQGKIDYRHSSSDVYIETSEGRRQVPISLVEEIISHTPSEQAVETERQRMRDELARQVDADIHGDMPLSPLQPGQTLSLPQGEAVVRSVDNGRYLIEMLDDHRQVEMTEGELQQALFSDGQTPVPRGPENSGAGQVLEETQTSPVKTPGEIPGARMETSGVNQEIFRSESEIPGGNTESGGADLQTQAGRIENSPMEGENSQIEPEFPKSQIEFPKTQAGEIDYSGISDPDVYRQALESEFGEDSSSVLSEMVAEAEAEMKKAEKKKSAIERARARRRASLELEKLQRVIELFAGQTEAETSMQTPVEDSGIKTDGVTGQMPAPVEEETPESGMPATQKSVVREETLPAEQPQLTRDELSGEKSDLRLVEETPGPEETPRGETSDKDGGEFDADTKALTEAEARVDTDPSPGQKEAGNYRKGHIRIGRREITIENPKGSVRSGTDRNGKPWQLRNGDASETIAERSGSYSTDGGVIREFDSYEQAQAYRDRLAQEKGKTDEKGESVRFREEDSMEDINERFNQDLEKYEKGEAKSGSMFFLGRPSKNLQSAGLNDTEIFMTQRVLHSHLQKHGLSIEDIRNLPAALQDPLMVYEWGKKAKSLIVVTQIPRAEERITVAVKLERNGERLEVNEVASVHGKSIERLLSEMSDDRSDFGREKLRYVEKKEALKWLNSPVEAPLASRRSATQELTLVTKIIKEFKNPTLQEGKMMAEADNLSDRLHTPVKIIRDASEIKEDNPNLQRRKRESKGWYDLESGQVVVVLANTVSVEDVQKTILHEVVAHKGLREMLGGERFDRLCQDVFDMLPEGSRQSLLKKYKDPFTCGEEYLATLAEQDVTPSLWQKIKARIKALLRETGIDLKLSDNDLKYLLWKSKHRLTEEDGSISMEGKTVADFKVGENILSRTTEESVEIINERFNRELESLIDGSLPKNHIYELGHPSSVLLSSGLPDLPIELAASRLSDKSMQENHPFDLSGIRDLPWAVQSPLAVFRSATHLGSFVVLTELEYNGKNFVTAIQANHQRGRIEVNSIRSIYPKNLNSILSWIKDGLMEYADKKNMPEWISKQRSNSADVRNTLRHVTKIVKEFENPTLSRGEIQAEISGLSQTLNTPIRVVRDVNEIKDGNPSREKRKRGSKGWFDASTGEVVVVLTNATSPADVQRTILHETVAHKGLREMLPGKKFDRLCSDVFDMLGKEQQERLLRRYGDKSTCGEEYLAGLAEEDITPSLWQKIKARIKSLFRDMGIDLRLSDNDLKYLLWKSKNRLMEGDSALGMAGKSVDDFKMRKLLFREEGEVIPVRDGYERKVESQGFLIHENQVDELASLKLVEDLMEASGEKIRDWENPYMNATAVPGKIQAESEVFQREFFSPIVEALAPLHRIEGSERVNNYLLGKSGLERNEVFRRREIEEIHRQAEADIAVNPDQEAVIREAAEKKIEDIQLRDFGGITALQEELGETSVEDFVRGFEEAYPETGELWKRIKRATDEILSIEHRSGMITRELKDELKGRMKHYLPLRGFSLETAGDVYEYFLPAFTNVNDPLRKAQGRTSKADDPIATIAQMGEYAISRGNRNILNQQLLALARNHPTDLLSISREWLVNQGTKENPQWEKQAPEFREGMTPEEFAREVESFNARMEELQKEGRAKPESSKLDMGLRITPRQASQHEVRIREGGKEYVVYVNGNPRLAQALNGELHPGGRESKLKHSDAQQRWRRAAEDTVYRAMHMGGNAGKYFRAMNRQLAANFTTRNPEFVISNLSRDLIFAASTLPVKEGASYAGRFIRNIPDASGALFRHLTGKADLSRETDKLLQEFILNGGRTGFTALHNLDQFKRDTRRQIKKLNGKMDPIAAFRLMSRFFGKCNSWAEDLSRFSTYMTSRGEGRSIQRSISDAKEITVNFNRKGSGGGWNQSLKTLFLFYNAAMQSLNQFRGMYKKNPKGTAALVGGFTLMGFLVAALNEAAGGDDDKEKYASLPDWIRENNLCIPLGGGFMTIPLPIELRAFYGIGEMFYQYMAGRKQGKDMPLEMLKKLAELTPIDPFGGEQPFTPDVLKPLIQADKNKNFFGRRIYKNSYSPYQPDYLKALPSTNRFLVEAAKSLNEATGGDAGKKGAVDINPALVEHFIESYTGGMGKFINRTGKTLTAGLEAASGGEPHLEVKDVPMVNRFYTAPGEDGALWRINEQYYKLLDEMKQFEESRRAYRREIKNGDEREKYVDKLRELMSSPQGERYRIIHSAQREIDGLRRGMELIDDQGTLDRMQAEIVRRKKALLEEIQ